MSASWSGSMTRSGAPFSDESEVIDARISWLQHGHWVGASDAVKRLRLQVGRCVRQSRPVLLSGEIGTGCAQAARQIFDFVHSGAGWHVVSPSDDFLLKVTQRSAGVLLREIETFSPEEQDDLAGHLTCMHDVAPWVYATSRLTCDQLQQGAFVNPTLLRHFAPEIIELPPLRNRLDDIPALCASWEKTLLLLGRRLTSDAIAWCRGRSWPGNIRQLRHVIGRAARATSDDVIGPELLAKSEAASLAGYMPSAQSMEDLIMRYVDVLVGDGRDVSDVHSRVIAKIERPMIQRIMEVTNRNQLRAAQILGLNRNTLRKKLRLLDILAERS